MIKKIIAPFIPLIGTLLAVNNAAALDINDLLVPVPGPVHTSAGILNFTGSVTITGMTITAYQSGTDGGCTSASANTPLTPTGSLTPNTSISYAINKDYLGGYWTVDGSDIKNDTTACMTLTTTPAFSTASGECTSGGNCWTINCSQQRGDCISRTGATTNTFNY